MWHNNGSLPEHNSLVCHRTPLVWRRFGYEITPHQPLPLTWILWILGRKSIFLSHSLAALVPHKAAPKKRELVVAYCLTSRVKLLYDITRYEQIRMEVIPDTNGRDRYDQLSWSKFWSIIFLEYPNDLDRIFCIHCLLRNVSDDEFEYFLFYYAPTLR